MKESHQKWINKKFNFHRFDSVKVERVYEEGYGEDRERKEMERELRELGDGRTLERDLLK